MVKTEKRAKMIEMWPVFIYTKNENMRNVPSQNT